MTFLFSFVKKRNELNLKMMEITLFSGFFFYLYNELGYRWNNPVKTLEDGIQVFQFYNLKVIQVTDSFRSVISFVVVPLLLYILCYCN